MNNLAFRYLAENVLKSLIFHQPHLSDDEVVRHALSLAKETLEAIEYDEDYRELDGLVKRFLPMLIASTSNASYSDLSKLSYRAIRMSRDLLRGFEEFEINGYVPRPMATQEKLSQWFISNCSHDDRSCYITRFEDILHQFDLLKRHKTYNGSSLTDVDGRKINSISNLIQNLKIICEDSREP